MFTGLVQALGRVVEVTPRRGATRLGIASPLRPARMRRGDSIAVDGVCLTVVSRSGNRFVAEVVAETLSRTTLGRLRTGDRVNLECPLRMADPLGGHLVQGHVDATVPVLRVLRRGDDYRLRLGLAPPVRRYVSEKGSVALQGVSLTVSRLVPGEFEVALIPTTRTRTTLGRVRSGDCLNLEVDLMARYLERLIESQGNPGGRKARVSARERKGTR